MLQRLGRQLKTKGGTCLIRGGPETRAKDVSLGHSVFLSFLVAPLLRGGLSSSPQGQIFCLTLSLGCFQDGKSVRVVLLASLWSRVGFKEV